MGSATITLRPYQEAAVQAVLTHFRSSAAPACIVLPTGAGKSVVIAELARLAKGRVLVLAHVKELCEQNHDKFTRMGWPAGLYAAGLGRKDTGFTVTFASVQSVVRNLSAFAEAHSLLIVDECHRVSDAEDSQYGQVVDALARRNPKLKLLGLTATPYRLGMGFIYRYHCAGAVCSEEPRPFESCVYEVSLGEMIRAGYLVPPRVEDAPIAQYDFSALAADPNAGEAEVNRLLVSHPRVTQAIVVQVMSLAEAQVRAGVMLFAASVAHAREIASYLPPGEVALILGETPLPERDALIAAFRERKLRYLVNVAVLTTGFDVPHVDFIALLRPTQSVGLFQQIVGRGLRLAPGKRDCLVMDYAGTGFNVFQPEVSDARPGVGTEPVSVVCPVCAFDNAFWGKRDAEGRVVEHYGRRCQAFTVDDQGQRERCEYRFRFKACGRCDAENDIAARSCSGCGAVLVDPDDQLKQALKLKNALVLRVAGMTLEAKAQVLTVRYYDEAAVSVAERFDFSSPKQRAVFNRVFARRLAQGRHPLALEASEHALRLQGLLPVPDFVVARKVQRHYRVQERIFDYAGNYRRANELR
ncbi:MAG: DEAD/DEAH box helicase [Polyangiales bacterium]